MSEDGAGRTFVVDERTRRQQRWTLWLLGVWLVLTVLTVVVSRDPAASALMILVAAACGLSLFIQRRMVFDTVVAEAEAVELRNSTRHVRLVWNDVREVRVIRIFGNSTIRWYTRDRRYQSTTVADLDDLLDDVRTHAPTATVAI